MKEGLNEFSDAWELLRTNWEIKPKNGGISFTPGYSMIRFIFSPLVRCLLRIKTTGTENLPKKGPTILAGNHLSHVDPVLIIASSRKKAHYLAKDGHFKNFFLRMFMNITGQIETHREEGGDSALSSAADVLESSATLGIFPEGTRSKKTEKPFLLPGKTGVARLAAAYPNATIIPVALNGTRSMMRPQNDKLPKIWKKIEINYGKGITWLEWLSHEQGGDMTPEMIKMISKQEKQEIKASIATLYRKFTDQLMNSISKLGAP